MAQNKLLDEISIIPGVTGSCIFDNQEGPLYTDSECTIATSVLQKAGSSLTRMFKMGKMLGLPIAGTRFRFDSCTVVSTPLGQDALLLTICDTTANYSLVAKTAAMLATDLEKHLKRSVSDLVTPETEELDLQVLEREEDPPANQDLQQYYVIMEEALAEAIGPISGMIVQETIGKWQEKGPANTSRLQELAEMLTEEIDDYELVKAFKTRIEVIL